MATATTIDALHVVGFFQVFFDTTTLPMFTLLSMFSIPPIPRPTARTASSLVQTYSFPYSSFVVSGVFLRS